MDGTAAISGNLEALKRILAGLAAMAGLAGVDLRAGGSAAYPHTVSAPIPLSHLSFDTSVSPSTAA